MGCVHRKPEHKVSRQIMTEVRRLAGCESVFSAGYVQGLYKALDLIEKIDWSSGRDERYFNDGLDTGRWRKGQVNDSKE